jgi:hypothetical protein
VLIQIAKYALRYLDGLFCVQMERDNANHAGEQAPPVMSSKLVAFSPSQFFSIMLDRHRNQVSKFCIPEAIETIERDQRELRDTYSSETTTKNRIDAHTDLTNFNEAWDDWMVIS